MGKQKWLMRAMGLARMSLPKSSTAERENEPSKIFFTVRNWERRRLSCELFVTGAGEVLENEVF
jgi:hypothetical protein